MDKEQGMILAKLRLDRFCGKSRKLYCWAECSIE